MKIGLEKHDEHRLAVRFSYDAGIVETIRAISGRSWNSELRAWLIPYTVRAMEELKEQFERTDVEIETSLREECQTLREWERVESELRDVVSLSWTAEYEHRLRQALALRGYSLKTIKAYCSQVACYYRYLAEHRLPEDDQAVQAYSLYMLERSSSHSHVNQAISAIKLFKDCIFQ